eukprot:2283258-Amphidinium_carterae.1
MQPAATVRAKSAPRRLDPPGEAGLRHVRCKLGCIVRKGGCQPRARSVAFCSVAENGRWGPK